MGASMGRETDAVEFLAALAAEPYRYDFYQTLRRLECLYQDKPRVGCAQRPADEPVRFGQVPDLTFAPAPLASFEVRDGELPRLQVRLFGLFGPNGPLPLHITEYAHERLLNANDSTVARFFDLFHHRFLAFFYRAWAQAQPMSVVIARARIRSPAMLDLFWGRLHRCSGTGMLCRMKRSCFMPAY